MKYYLIPLLVTFSLLNVTSCGGDNESVSANQSGPVSPSSIAGTYTLKSLSCEGERVALFDYSETLVLNSDGSATSTQITPICKAVESFTFEPIRDQNTFFLESKNVQCTQLSDPYHDGLCSLLYKLNHQALHYECPQSFPMTYGYWTVSQSGNTLTTQRDGAPCSATYEKKIVTASPTPTPTPTPESSPS